jgi:two-component system, chemotaxis family, chemotaxis protein CheY
MTSVEPTHVATRPRVLIVDDAVTIRMYHRQLVEAADCTVAEAGNGIEALERALQQPFSLFLVDVNMPRMDGYRFIAEARRTNGLRHVPAIMISTEAEADDRQKGYRAGANLYLVKPVRPAVLQACVRLMTAENGR